MKNYCLKKKFDGVIKAGPNRGTHYVCFCFDEMPDFGDNSPVRGQQLKFPLKEYLDIHPPEELVNELKKTNVVVYGNMESIYKLFYSAGIENCIVVSKNNKYVGYLLGANIIYRQDLPEGIIYVGPELPEAGKDMLKVGENK